VHNGAKIFNLAVELKLERVVEGALATEVTRIKYKNMCSSEISSLKPGALNLFLPKLSGDLSDEGLVLSTWLEGCELSEVEISQLEDTIGSWLVQKTLEHMNASTLVALLKLVGAGEVWDRAGRALVAGEERGRMERLEGEQLHRGLNEGMDLLLEENMQVREEKRRLQEDLVMTRAMAGQLAAGSRAKDKLIRKLSNNSSPLLTPPPRGEIPK
jgi:hypothetical protein